MTAYKKSAETVKIITLELGGHAPVIIFNDVHIDNIAKNAFIAKFRNNGQVCVYPTRFYVHYRLLEEFTGIFIESTNKLSIGDGLNTTTDIGPLIN